MIIDTEKNIFNIMSSINANRFIYYFKRLPLIGKILPDSIYGNHSLKKNVSVIAMILRVFRKFLGKMIFIGLLLVLPVVLLEKNTAMRYAAYLHIFAAINIIGQFVTSSAFESDRDRYICIRLMHMNAKRYIISTILFQDIMDIFYFLPGVLLSTAWMGGSLLQGFLLTSVIAGSSLAGETFFLLFYSRTGIMLSNKSLYMVSAGTICLMTAYIPVLLHKPVMLSGLLFNPVFILLMLFLFIYCIFVILNYDRYHEIAFKSLKASKFTIDTHQIMAEANFSDVVMREKEFKDSELKSNKFKNKEGFAYLNTIFFERHRRLLVKPVLIQLAVITVLFLAATAAGYFVPKFIKPLSNPSTILPGFVFIMYLVSIGERVCKAMFYNCDISLLRYSFYRDRNAILSNFKVRLLHVAGLNLIIAFAISAAVIGLALIFRLEWSTLEVLSFALSILFLSLFFSVHHLFLYYVFQPYTTELEMKNPFYNGINYGVYFLCFFCTKIKSPPSYFILIVLVSTILYIVTALILVYKYAPKTFRVK